MSHEAAKLGLRVGPPIDLSSSQHFDILEPGFGVWLYSMLKAGKVRSIMLEPPCTTFSPAAHPCLRTYRLPEGIDRRHPRVMHGNALAQRCLVFFLFALRFGCPALFEQPRGSKLAWTSWWRNVARRLGVSEWHLASCMYGSPHRKEFRLLGCHIRKDRLCRACSRDHDHIPIQGARTKQSAVYTEGVVRELAKSFAEVLALFAAPSPSKPAFESVVFNDILMSASWQVCTVIPWHSQCHINVLELASYGALVCDLARSSAGSRFVALLDSQVAKAAAAKGRSTSKALSPGLRRIAAHQLAFGLYPALGFAPTRLNIADDPTRFAELGEPCLHSLHKLLPAQCLRGLGELRFSRPQSGWVRLFLLLHVIDGPPTDFLRHAVSGRFGTEACPYTPDCHRDFDNTLGFPGEGPVPQPLLACLSQAFFSRSPFLKARALFFTAVSGFATLLWTFSVLDFSPKPPLTAP